jgi:hypothetical protein
LIELGMRLGSTLSSGARLICSCVLVVVACDRAPMQPISPSGPTRTPTAAAGEPIREAPTAEEQTPGKPIAEPIAESAAEEQNPTEPSSEATEMPESSQTSGACCRTCRKGKACGDTCVARDRECTVAPGCACDG